MKGRGGGIPPAYQNIKECTPPAHQGVSPLHIKEGYPPPLPPYEGGVFPCILRYQGGVFPLHIF